MVDQESSGDAPSAPARSKDEVAVELMKFIAVTTGYGKSPQGSTGFSGKPVARSAPATSAASTMPNAAAMEPKPTLAIVRNSRRYPWLNWLLHNAMSK